MTLEPLPCSQLPLVDRPQLVRGQVGLQHLVQGERLQAESGIFHGGSKAAFGCLVGETRNDPDTQEAAKTLTGAEKN